MEINEREWIGRRVNADNEWLDKWMIGRINEWMDMRGWRNIDRVDVWWIGGWWIYEWMEIDIDEWMGR